MKYNLSTFLILFFCFFTEVQAQKVVCGYDLLIENIKKDQLHYNAIQSEFRKAKDHQNKFRDTEVLTIPVTFHVVWNDSTENISESLIHEQIEVLNDDYRRTNIDSENVREEFVSVVGDSYIQFELKEIIRVHTDTLFEFDLVGIGALDYLKNTSDGGSDAVNTKENLNVWICNIQPLMINGIPLGALLGYAYPPADLENWPDMSNAPNPAYEGVVLDYRTIGLNNPNIISIDGLVDSLGVQGRTAVHEIGHYLGLRHISGDAVEFFGEDGCLVDDGVEDTPNCATLSNFACDYTKNTCIDSIGDLPDMIENYMDYSEEVCMNSFTLGQIDIMRGVLRNSRCMLVGNCDMVDIDRLVMDNTVQMFPNPAHSKVTLIVNNEKSVDSSVDVYNSLGQLVYTDSFHNLIEIEVSKFKSGLYFLRIEMGNTYTIKNLLVN